MTFRAASAPLTALGLVALLVSAALPDPTAAATTAARQAGSPVVVADMANFSQALKAVEDGEPSEAALQRLYFDRASPGLQAYVRRRSLTAQRLAGDLQRNPRFYASLARLWSAPEATVAAIDDALARLKTVIPSSPPAPVYVFVGGMETGALADPAGVLAPVETAAIDDRINLSELTPGRVEMMRPLSDLPHIAAHEMVHVNQAITQGMEAYRRLYDGTGTRLQFAIREGSADFLADLATGGHANAPAHRYGVQHEAALWAEFSTGLDSTEPGGWFFGRPTDRTRPSDLGYFLGYRIVEAYYRNSPDKVEAVGQILAVTDYPAFLARSGYPD